MRRICSPGAGAGDRSEDRRGGARGLVRFQSAGLAWTASDDTRGIVYCIPAGETGLVEGPANSETARRKEQGRSEPQAHQAA